MAGNVWEWTNDGYDEDYYQYSPVMNPTGPENADMKVVRGVSWYNNAEYIPTTYRRGKEAQIASNATGFRCAANNR